MARTADTNVPCSSSTRERLRSLKRGGETYDQLLRKLIKESDRQPAPDAGHSKDYTFDPEPEA